MASGNCTGPDFISNLCFLLCVSLLANGVYCLFSPYVDFSVCWYLIIDFLLIILISIPNPPILALFFELATMARLPDIRSKYNYEDPTSLKFAASWIAGTNAVILMSCYATYYIGTSSARKRYTQTPADGQLTFPRLHTGMNAFLEIMILFSCNSALMILVSVLQFQERSAVICGLIMVLFSILCLLTMMGRMTKAVTARLSQPAATGAAASDQEKTERLELELPVEEAPEVESSADDDDHKV